DSEIEALLQRARNGCQEAARQILELCSNHVRSAVRRYLDTRLRSLIDLDDLTQDVWTNFFEHILPARSFNSVPHLRCFLQGMARITVARAHRKHLPRATHTVFSEQSLEETPIRDGAQGDPAPVTLVEDEWRERVRREPAVIRSILEMLGAGLPTE